MLNAWFMLKNLKEDEVDILLKDKLYLGYICFKVKWFLKFFVFSGVLCDPK